MEFTLADERRLWAQVTRDRVAALELATGQIVRALGAPGVGPEHGIAALATGS